MKPTHGRQTEELERLNEVLVNSRAAILCNLQAEKAENKIVTAGLAPANIGQYPGCLPSCPETNLGFIRKGEWILDE